MIEFGINGAFGNRSVTDARLLSNHSIVLVGLSPATVYNYRVHSSDAAGNITISGTHYFATLYPPPPPSSDADADDMDDAWERQYGLDPADGTDAGTDKDGDGLTNFREYQLGSNPSSNDSDSDGMPDKWEFDNNLLVASNDAGNDPDNDGESNVNEYKNGTDPHKSDIDVTATSSAKKLIAGLPVWAWIVIVILIILIAWMLGKSKRA